MDGDVEDCIVGDAVFVSSLLLLLAVLLVVLFLLTLLLFSVSSSSFISSGSFVLSLIYDVRDFLSLDAYSIPFSLVGVYSSFNNNDNNDDDNNDDDDTDGTNSG